MQQQGKMRQVLSLLILVILLPALIVLSLLYESGKYSYVSIVVIAVSLIAFFISFEKRKPQLAEIVLLAVMCAIAVTSRMIFAFVPQFKPILAVVIITGIHFGAEAGFLCGSLSMLLSNFMFGHGPWTVWQMFACGVVGFVSGMLSNTIFMKKRSFLAISGFVLAFVYSIFVEVGSFLTISKAENQTMLTLLVAGVPFYIILAVATFIFLLLISDEMKDKLERIKKKYGLFK